MTRCAVLIKHGQVDPTEIGRKSCTPDHIGYIEGSSIFKQRLPIIHPYYPRSPLHSGSHKIFEGEANEWGAVRGLLCSEGATKRSTHRKDMVEDPPGKWSVELEGNVTGIRASQMR
jgi:hypothetical protein